MNTTYKVHVLFGQRKCRYDGEYAPEALEICDEYMADENPDWIAEKKMEYEKSNEFSSLAVVPIVIPYGILEKRLFPEVTPISGEIK